MFDKIDSAPVTRHEILKTTHGSKDLEEWLDQNGQFAISDIAAHNAEITGRMRLLYFYRTSHDNLKDGHVLPFTPDS